MGDDRRAVASWKDAAAYDPEDPSIYLGRARSFRRLGASNRALSDLELAASWSAGQPSLLVPIAFESWLASRGLPSGRPRALALTRRAVASLPALLLALPPQARVIRRPS